MLMTNRQQKEQQLQMMYMQFQMMKQQMDEAVQNKQVLDQKIAELINTKNAVSGMKKAKKDSEIWTPLGSDTYTTAKLTDVSKVAINVGMNVVVKKTIPEALKILDKRETELQDIDKQLTAHIQQLQAQMRMLEQTMQNAISEAENAEKDTNAKKPKK